FPFPIGPSIPKSQLITLLPPADYCDYLIAQYFLRLSPLFRILHGPTFQRQHNSFQDRPEEVEFAWLAFLFTICSLTLNTMGNGDPTISHLWPRVGYSEGLLAAAAQYRHSYKICLSQDQFL
ncbi:fungal specific transcription factor domain-containing protein, partial [Aspergillus homomorphus CBS 101889]